MNASPHGQLKTKVRAYVLDKIGRAIWVEGDKLPTDKDLSGKLGASQQTVRAVLSELAGQGYFNRYPGKGTFVASQAASLAAASRARRMLLMRPGVSSEATEQDFTTLTCRAVENEAHRRGWEVSIEIAASMQVAGARLSQLPLTTFDAIVFLPTGEPIASDVLRLAGESGHPFIFLDRDMADVQAHSVAVDNRRGGELAARYLLGLGHKRVAVVISEPLVSSGVNRLKGFVGAMDMVGIEPRVIDCRMDHLADRYARTHEMVSEALAERLDVTALFVISDAGAVGAMRAVADAGLAVPHDISVLGFDGVPMGAYQRPSLSSIGQPLERMAAAVMDIAAGGETFSHVAIHPELIIRESTARPAAVNGRPHQICVAPVSGDVVPTGNAQVCLWH